jgi:hypothetical protein
MTKTNTESKKTATDAVKLIGTWQDRLADGIKNQKKIFDVAKENYQIWFAQTPDDKKTTDQWRSDIFLPILPGKARDAKAKMSILEPRYRVIPADAWKFDGRSGEMSFDDKALIKAMKVSKKLNREFIQHQSNGGLPPRAALDACVTDAMVAGWGLGLAPVKVYRKIYKLRQALQDLDGKPSAYVDREKKALTKKLLRVCTELVPLDIFRVYGSSKMTSWEEAPWLIHEREETLANLKKANVGKGEQVFKNLELLDGVKATATKSEYAAVRDAVHGYSQDGSDRVDDTVTSFMVRDCYDAETNRFYTFVEAKVTLDSPDAHKGWLCIRDIENPYDHGLMPVVPFYVKRRPHSPWGESFFEIAKDVQYAANAAFNQFSDNATLSTETMAVVDKRSMVSDYEIYPGKAIEYDSLDGEAPQPWKFNDPNPAVMETRMGILEKNIENGTTPQYTTGQVDSSMDKTNGTRGGIEMMVEMANDRISEMYRELKSSLLRYGYMSLSNAQQFQTYIEVLDTPDMSASGQQAMAKGMKQKVDVLTPVDLQEAYDLDIDDESLLPMTKAERRRMYEQFINSLLALHKASVEQAQLFDTPEDIMRLDWPDISKEIGSQYGELNAPAFIMEPRTKDELNQQKQKDVIAEQQAMEGAKQVAAQANPGADVDQQGDKLSVQYQKRELGNIDKYPADVQNEAYQSLGYQPSQLLDEQAKAQLAEARATQLDTQVKEEMVAKAASGKIDPEALSKFIKK